MNAKEMKRFEIFARVQRKEISLQKAAELLDLGYRQVRRLWKRFQQQGKEGLRHQSCGKASGRAKPTDIRTPILARYQERYRDFGPTLAAEKLTEEGFSVDHETLRRWLLESGDWSKGRRKKLHRSRRKSREHFGELVQMDGSFHAWFEERGEHATLMSMIDDATNTSLALLSEMETTESALQVLWKWIERYGIPQCLYTDRHSVYYGTTGEQEKTQFGRACQDLGIRIIFARSPQAKGRVEKWNAIYQDRLVKELRLHGLSSLSEANALLARGFVENLNAKFSVAAQSPVDFHRPVNVDLNLLHVLSVREVRRVSNDWVIRWHNRVFQIVDQPDLPRAGSRVEVRLYLDNSLHLFHHGNELRMREIVSRSTQVLEPKTFREQQAEKFQRAQELQKAGLPLAMIAQEVQLAEQTVRKYLQAGQVPGPKQRTKRGRITKAYETFITQWLAEKPYEATEIHAKLRILGYRGSLRTVQRIVKEFKAQRQVESQD